MQPTTSSYISKLPPEIPYDLKAFDKSERSLTAAQWQLDASPSPSGTQDREEHRKDACSAALQ